MPAGALHAGAGKGTLSVVRHCRRLSSQSGGVAPVPGLRRDYLVPLARRAGLSLAGTVTAGSIWPVVVDRVPVVLTRPAAGGGRTGGGI